MENNKNATAFPQLHIIDGNWIKDPKEKYQGLTKRELAAYMAMQGFLSNSNDEVQFGKEGNNPMPVPSEIARLSIEIADELLKQLEDGTKTD